MVAQMSLDAPRTQGFHTVFTTTNISHNKFGMGRTSFTQMLLIIRRNHGNLLTLL